MLNRWIIVGEPRCGSHWLQSKLLPQAWLDELINYDFYSNANHNFVFDDNNFVKSIYDVPTMPLTLNEFVQKRIDQIKQISPEQHVKGILFCNVYTIDHEAVIKTLHECNFKFIMLERNLFDRAISHCIATLTKFAHRWNFNKNAPAPDSLSSVRISLDTWLDTLFREYKATEYRKSLFKNYNFLTVRYENLIEDCQTNDIPIIKKESISKTWNVEYTDIVTNIKELREVYNSFETCIHDYSRFNLRYAR
jgi:hypothetical protein